MDAAHPTEDGLRLAPRPDEGRISILSVILNPSNAEGEGSIFR